jgi:hypothetical protein
VGCWGEGVGSFDEGKAARVLLKGGAADWEDETSTEVVREWAAEGGGEGAVTSSKRYREHKIRLACVSELMTEKDALTVTE